MMRVASVALFALCVAALVGQSALAQLPVAPPPREVRPDGTRPPAPQPEAPAKDEDPTAVVDRIIKNSKDVGDKLAKTDTGAGTRKTQDKILADIDSLINRQENPPPQSNDNKDNEKDKNQDNKQDKQDKNNDPMGGNQPMNQDMPPPKGGNMPMDKNDTGRSGMGKQDGMPMGGMGGMNEQQPMGGDAGNGRRPRMGDPKGGQKQPDKADAKKDPAGANDKKVGSKPKDPNNKGNPGGGGTTGSKGAARPSLPFDEDVAKDVWGHLPYKLRQQMTQYYKEDVMPKYSELLRLYYSSLSDKSGNPAMPKR